MPDKNSQELTNDVKKLLQKWSLELGFSGLAVTDTDLSDYIDAHQRCIRDGLHGDMKYLERNQTLRYMPEKLVPGTLRIICVRMNYLPDTTAAELLKKPEKAYIARYALGRDYHKVMRKRLNQLAEYLIQKIGKFGYRAFVDSAPVLERQLAEKSGLGWIGKNTLLLNKDAGSWFFLGEIYTDLPLPIDKSEQAQHCGACTACLDICPTKAFVSPWRLDARRCISYLTIEQRGAIPLELRPLLGNRIFGCDDCQIFCPWTKFAQPTQETAFQPRHNLDDTDLVTLFLWTEQEFLKYTAGSPIRRTGYLGWLRNIAVALGNAPSSNQIIAALQQRAQHSSKLVQEHVHWALQQHGMI